MDLYKKLWVDFVTPKENPIAPAPLQSQLKTTTTKSKRIERKRKLVEVSEKNNMVKNNPTKRKAIESEVPANIVSLDIEKKSEIKMTSNETRNFQLKEAKPSSVSLTTKEPSLFLKETKNNLKPANCLIHVRITHAIAKSIGKVRLCLLMNRDV